MVGAGRHAIQGLTGWVLARLARGRRRAAPRLALVERIALAPRHSVALIEAEGRRILVATSADGASAFFPLDDRVQSAARNTAESAAPSFPVRGPKPAAISAPKIGTRVSS
jgi:flagellar biogenesis protein FliO